MKARTASWYSGPRAESIAAGHFANLQAAVGRVVVGDQFIDHPADLVAHLALTLPCCLLLGIDLRAASLTPAAALHSVSSRPPPGGSGTGCGSPP